jgi:hypothetical protein
LEGDIINDLKEAQNLIDKSNDTITIDNQYLILETDIYRNLTPGGPLSKRDTRIVVPFWVVNIDSTLITDKFELSQLYIILENQIWISQPMIEKESYEVENRLHGISKSGPEWQTGLSVDIVLKMIDFETNEDKYLIARDQIIEKVE